MMTPGIFNAVLFIYKQHKRSFFSLNYKESNRNNLFASSLWFDGSSYELKMTQSYETRL